MGYECPLLELPAAQALLDLSEREREAIAVVLTDLRLQANDKAETSWRKMKAVASYYRAVSTYARHFAFLLRRGLPKLRQMAEMRARREEALHAELARARAEVNALIGAARAVLPITEHPVSACGEAWAAQLRLWRTSEGRLPDEVLA